MSEHQSKNSRILNIYVRLCSGFAVSKVTEARRFGVDERTIQRDIDDIRSFLLERGSGDTGDSQEIVYDRYEGGFVMRGGKSPLMSNSEILAVSKILLDSRAFTKKEICVILDKMIAGCVPEKNLKVVSDLIANEKYHYIALRHGKELNDLLWDIGMDIREHRRIEIKYKKMSKDHKASVYIVEPVGLLFSEFYFYLNAFICETDENGEFVHKYQYPAIFRLDRISSRIDTKSKFSVIYSNRFEEGEYRKRIQFMFAGELLKVRFKYYGLSADAVLDRLPTARVLESTEDHQLVEAEVYGKGIVMWLLSQGKMVEVLKPESLRNEIREQLLDALKYYE